MKVLKMKYETPGFELTPEQAKLAQEQADRMLAARNKEKAALKAARDARLQTIGINGSDKFYMDKLAEVKQLTKSVEEFAVSGAAGCWRRFHKLQKLMLQKLLQSLSLRKLRLQPYLPSSQPKHHPQMILTWMTFL